LPSLNRGYVDLDRGIFKRKPDDKKETSKRQPHDPAPASPSVSYETVETAWY
jgi:hypothetical protein